MQRLASGLATCCLLVSVGTALARAPGGEQPLEAPAPSPCADATTTLAMTECLAQEVRRAERRLAQVLAAAEARVQQERRGVLRPAAALEPIDLAAGQRLWLAYRQAHCAAISRRWSGASLQPVMGAECLLRLTRARSHELWSAFLTFPDGTPPLLPDPTAPEPVSPPPRRPR